jgi:uncharacterized damage-inducible protein DinB
MAPTRQLRRLFAYHDWANREAVASLKQAAAPPPFALAVMAHIFAADRLWLARLTRSDEKVVVWPSMSLEECVFASENVPRLWARYLASRSDRDLDLDEIVSYVTSRGEHWTNTAGDILQHVVLHAAHHRGQVASALRVAGHEPAATDFIVGVRKGLIE